MFDSYFSGGFGGTQILFSVFPILFLVVFLFVLGFIISFVIRHIKQERKNDRSPRLTVDAKVVTKRTSFYHSSGDMHHTGHGHTSYYVTFEVQSGDRMELQLQGTEYGFLAEGDRGELTFQGTRFVSFARKVVNDDL